MVPNTTFQAEFFLSCDDHFGQEIATPLTLTLDNSASRNSLALPGHSFKLASSGGST